MIDARVGVTPLDQIFRRAAAPRDKPVVLAANKAEGRAGDVGVSEAYALASANRSRFPPSTARA